jgi:hypothetical protein
MTDGKEETVLSFLVLDSADTDKIFFEEIDPSKTFDLDSAIKVILDFSKTHEGPKTGKMFLVEGGGQKIILQFIDKWIFGAVVEGNITKAEYKKFHGITKDIMTTMSDSLDKQISSDGIDLRDCVRKNLGLPSLKVQQLDIESKRQLNELLAKAEAVGGKTDNLAKGFSLPLDERKKFIEKMSDCLSRWLIARKKMATMNVKGVEEDAKEIRVLLLEPTLVDEAIKRISQLELKVQALRAKKADDEVVRQIARQSGIVELEGEITRLEVMGYNVVPLRRIYAMGDFEVARHSVETYKQNIEKIKELKAHLERLDITGFEHEIEEVRELMTDPSKVWKIEETIKGIENKINSETEREKKFQALEAKLRAWEAEGYNTAYLYEVLTQDIAIIEEAFATFEANLARLKNLERRLNKVDTSRCQAETARIREMLKDTNRVDEAEAAMKDLLDIISQSMSLDSEIDEWAKDGFDVSRLKKAKARDLTEYYNLHTWFKERVSQLRNCERGLRALKANEYPKDVATISLMLRDVDRVDEVKAMLQSLKSKVHTTTTNITLTEAPIKSEVELLQVLSSLPRGLPSTLWGKSMEDLALEVVNGKYAETTQGDVIVQLRRKWYYGDPHDIGTFLQLYKGDVIDIE